MNGVKYLSVARLSRGDMFEIVPYPYRDFKLSLSTALYANYSFSCEMFLKSIILFYSGKVHGHNLKELYNKLLANIKDLIQSQKIFSKESLQIEFEDLLEKMGDSFVFFRYNNENAGFTTNMNFLCGFAECLENISYN